MMHFSTRRFATSAIVLGTALLLLFSLTRKFPFHQRSLRAGDVNLTLLVQNFSKEYPEYLNRKPDYFRTTAPASFTGTQGLPLQSMPPNTRIPTTSVPAVVPTWAPTKRKLPLTTSLTTKHPVSSAPSTLAPVTINPTTKAPVTSRPTTGNPVTIALTTLMPVTSPPTTLIPITLTPKTLDPVTTIPIPSKSTTMASNVQYLNPPLLTSASSSSLPVLSSQVMPTRFPVTSALTTLTPVTSPPITLIPITLTPKTLDPVTATRIPSKSRTKAPNMQYLSPPLLTSVSSGSLPVLSSQVLPINASVPPPPFTSNISSNWTGGFVFPPLSETSFGGIPINTTGRPPFIPNSTGAYETLPLPQSLPGGILNNFTGYGSNSSPPSPFLVPSASVIPSNSMNQIIMRPPEVNRSEPHGNEPNSSEVINDSNDDSSANNVPNSYLFLSFAAVFLSFVLLVTIVRYCVCNSLTTPRFTSIA